MAELKFEDYTIREVSDGEFHLRVEEEKRECLQCEYFSATAENGQQYPAVLLRNRIKNKKAYEDTKVDSWWYLMQNRTKNTKILILKLDFQNAGVMKLFLDLSPGFLNKENREELMVWLQFLILSGGKVAIADGIPPAIGATGILLKLPNLILAGEL